MSERPRRMTQAERTARTRAKVLATAIDCLHAEGYAATTTSLVAQRSGSRGAMLHQFPTRADLMLAVVEAAFEEEMDLYDARFGAIADPKERVLAIPEAVWETLSRPAGVAVLEILQPAPACLDAQPVIGLWPASLASAELDNVRNALRAWAMTQGHEVIGRPFENYVNGVDAAFTADGEYEVFWTVKQ